MEPEGSLTGSIAAKDPAASSLQVTKGPASKGPPKTADRRRGQMSVAVCGHTSVHAAGVAGNPRTQWDVIEDKSFQLRLARFPRPLVLQAFGGEDLATTSMILTHGICMYICTYNYMYCVI